MFKEVVCKKKQPGPNCKRIEQAESSQSNLERHEQPKTTPNKRNKNKTSSLETNGIGRHSVQNGFG